jgi:hypothetical protein
MVNQQLRHASPAGNAQVDSKASGLVLPHISRRFTIECDLRAPTTGPTRLVVSHKSTEKHFRANRQSYNLPIIATSKEDTLFTDFEFDFNILDTYRVYFESMSRIEEYPSWIDLMFDSEWKTLTPTHGGKVHLRLFFEYLSNLDQLVRAVSQRGESFFQYTKISLILHNADRLQSVVDRLGLSFYSHEPRTVATWSMVTGWDIDKLAIKHGRAEQMLRQDPFAADADREIYEVDWTLAEDGDYDGMQGSGWVTDGSDIDESRADWSGGEEESSAGDESQMGSSWEVGDCSLALIDPR